MNRSRKISYVGSDRVTRTLLSTNFQASAHTVSANTSPVQATSTYIGQWLSLRGLLYPAKPAEIAVTQSVTSLLK